MLEPFSSAGRRVVAVTLTFLGALALGGQALGQPAPASAAAPPAAAGSQPSAKPEAPVSSWPDKLGPFGIAWGDGAGELQVGFAGQLLTSVKSVDGAPAGEARTVAEEVRLRRVRLLLKGYFFDKRLYTYLQLSTAPKSLELMDLMLDFKIIPELSLSAGQQKIPLGRHRSQSFQRLVLVDWAAAATQLGSERQLGLTLHNDPKTEWHYAAGVFTGVGARASFAKALATSYSEPLPNPSDLTDPAPFADLHPELLLHLAHGTMGAGVGSNSDDTGGPLRYLLSAGAAYDAQPEQARDLALRLTPEVLLKAYGASLNAVGYLGWYESTTGSFDLGVVGATGELAWRLSRHLELAARFSRVDYLEALRDDARGRAAGLIAAAAPDDLAAVTAQYRSAGTLRAEQEVSAGLNVYLIGDSLKWQHDLGWLHQDRDRGPKNDLLLRMQVQIAF